MLTRHMQVSFILLLPLALWGQLKIGYIDSNRIMREFEEVREAQVKLDKEARRLEAEYNTYVSRLDSLRRNFEKQELLIKDEARKLTMTGEIRQLEKATQQFQQNKFGPEGEIYRTQATLMAPILEKVDTAVKKIGAEREYDYIIDAVSGALVYALPAHEITDDVLRELRRSAGGTQTPPK